MTAPDLLDALDPVVDALQQLGLEYSVVGSVASSAHGIARSTVDADLVADLPLSVVDALVARLEPDYYVDRDAARDAVRRRSMFNVIHLSTMIKVDIYVLSERAFDRSSFARRQLRLLRDEPDRRGYHLDSPEDTVLHKLEWYRAGGEVSDRQWADIVGVLEVQGDALDPAYLDHWAAMLGVSDLLARAWQQAMPTP
jgi:hypothetical protein